jgi:methyl-accepting chemotaxis protein
MTEKREKKSSSIKKKTLLLVGLLIIVAISVVSLTAYFTITTSYNRLVESEKNNFDNNIKTAVETLISALQQNEASAKAGIITEEQALKNAKAIVRDTRYSSGTGKEDDGYFWADMADGLCVVHYNNENVGQMRWDNQDQEGTYYIRNCIENGDAGGGYSDFYFGKPGDENGSYHKRGYTEKFEPYGWYISTGNYADDMDNYIAKAKSEKHKSEIILLIMAVLVEVFSLIILSRTLTSITVPIKNNAKRISRLAKGDTSELDISEKSLKRNDEIGTLSRSIMELNTAMRQQASAIERVATGDLTVVYLPRSPQDSVGNSLRKMLENNNLAFEQINNASKDVYALSQSVAEDSQDTARRAENSATIIESLSSSILEVLDQTKLNAQSAKEAVEAVTKSSDIMLQSTESMRNLQTAMREIADSSENILGINKAIDEIAMQTNILSLNAAVEAARAGQYGKGFAVVADEVRSLSVRSADSAKITEENISGTISRVDEGLSAANLTGERLEQAAAYSEEVLAVISTINAASQQQEVAISKINESIEMINENVQANNHSSRQSADLSLEMQNQVEVLKETVSHFKLQDMDAGRDDTDF